jgi:hypothetical protein
MVFSCKVWDNGIYVARLRTQNLNNNFSTKAIVDYQLTIDTIIAKFFLSGNCNRKAMEESFITRIPKLSDAALLDYTKNPQKYKREAVELAMRELAKRGHALSREELEAIRCAIGQQDGRPISESPRHLFFSSIRSRHLQLTALIIALAGISGSLILFLTAEPAPPPPLGYDPLTMKAPLREMQVYGGMANVFATRFRQWFAGLWHGRPLACIVAVFSLSVAFLLWRIGTTPKKDLPDPR